MTPALRALVDVARHRVRNVARGTAIAAVVVVAITIAISGGAFYRQGPMVLVGLLLLIAGAFHAWYRTLGWDRNPVLRALRDAPDTIVKASVEATSGMPSLLDERQVTISTRDAWVMLTFHRGELAPLARHLAAACPNVELERFDGFA